MLFKRGGVVVLAALFACCALSVARAAAPTAAPAILKYLGALQHGDYAAAYALLTQSEKKYYRNAANFASVFNADQFKLAAFKVDKVQTSSAGQVAFVRETVSYLDHAHDKSVTAKVVVPIGALRENGGLFVKDPGHPWKAHAENVTGEKDKLRVTIKKVSFFPHRVQVVITFANVGDTAVTLLPYGRTVMHDDKGNVYRIIAVKDWRLTDRELFLGLRLAPSAQYTGSVNFELAADESDAKSFDLTVAPALRDGADAPFDVNVAAIALS